MEKYYLCHLVNMIMTSKQNRVTACLAVQAAGQVFILKQNKLGARSGEERREEMLAVACVWIKYTAMQTDADETHSNQ